MLVRKQLNGQAGYAMAALLVAMSVMAVLMTVAMPVWKQVARREKEEELIFRGQQYARAIGLFQRRAGPGVLAPSVDILVEQKFLRKKYKDPITGEDFDLIRGTQGTAAPGQIAQQGQIVQTGQTGAGGRGQPTQITNTPVAGGGGRIGAAPVGLAGGISGVVSKSKDTSIKIYNGRTHYNEWMFMYVAPVQAPTAGAPTPGATGQRGAPPPQPPGGLGGVGGFPGRSGPGPGGPGGRGNPAPFPQPQRGR